MAEDQRSCHSVSSSYSSIYGSLKSSKSSNNSAFGSCLSTTDTIGSFRTAFSGSLSTLYFSAKGDEADTNTLNWTMNYHSFDELSDTSTLIGDDDVDQIEERVQTQNLQNVKGSEENIDSIQESHEEKLLETSFDVPILISGEETTSEEDTVTLEESSIKIITGSDICCQPSIANNEEQTVASNQQNTTVSNKDCFQLVSPKNGSCVFVWILTSSLASIAVHLLLKKISKEKLSDWSLNFWRALFQLLFCVPFISRKLWKHRRQETPIPARSPPFVSRSHIVSGCLAFISAMFWLDISYKKLLNKKSCATFYCSTPLVIFIMEKLYYKKSRLPFKSGSVVFVLWTLALVAFSWPNTSFWHFGIQDSVFSWPIQVPDKTQSDLVLGHVLATLALITSSASLMLHTIDKSNSCWTGYLFWQAVGVFFAAMLGLVSIEGLPQWNSNYSWFPLLLSVLGIFANAILVKIMIGDANEESQSVQHSKNPTTFLFVKIGLEVLLVLFLDCNGVQMYETNVIIAVLLFSICLLIVIFTICRNKSDH